MLVRSYIGEMKFINRSDYVTNSDYYRKIMEIKFNRPHQSKNVQVENIISTILYG